MIQTVHQAKQCSRPGEIQQQCGFLLLMPASIKSSGRLPRSCQEQVDVACGEPELMVCLQEEFCVAKGFKTDCEVIYGDTDSVMVNFKVNSCRISSEPRLIVPAPQQLRCYHH